MVVKVARSKWFKVANFAYAPSVRKLKKQSPTDGGRRAFLHGPTDGVGLTAERCISRISAMAESFKRVQMPI